MRINYYRFRLAVVLAIGVLLFFSSYTWAQTNQGGSTSSKLGFGFRVGLNYAKVNSDADSIQYHYKQGLMFAVFFKPRAQGLNRLQK